MLSRVPFELDEKRLREGATAHLEWTLEGAHWNDAARSYGALILLQRHVFTSGPSWLMPARCIVSSMLELELLHDTHGVELRSVTWEPGAPVRLPKFAPVILHEDVNGQWWLQEDATVVHVDVHGGRKLEREVRVLTHLLRRGSLTRPELKVLIPPAPEGASVCPMCAGFGIASDGGGTCWCNGLGWE